MGYGARKQGKTMKIITINVVPDYLKVIEILLEKDLYPSRSELIRVAIREFLHRELKKVEDVDNFIASAKPDYFDANTMVRVPSNIIGEYITYKLKQRLD